MRDLRVIIFALTVLNVFLLAGSGDKSLATELYFLDVGQGDATLLMSGGVKILTDAGPGKSVVGEVAKAMGRNKYIDIAVITHPQMDHFNGFNYLLDEYEFGAFLINGRDIESREWKELIGKLEIKKIPLLVLGEGDGIKAGEVGIRVISPGPDALQSGELNDTSIVQLINSDGVNILLTADIGSETEDYLIKKYGDLLDVDILKIGHHGSKYSSNASFLDATSPKASLIGVGKSNRYGHPTPEALQRIQSQGSHVFRTDQDGNIKILKKDNVLELYTDRY